MAKIEKVVEGGKLHVVKLHDTVTNDLPQGIVINEALMFKRKDFSAMYKVESIDVVTESASISPQMEEMELIELIDQLPDGYKTVFLLHVVDGYSHKEIADNLKIAEGTSRSQFFKARTLLQKKLGNYYGTAIGK